MIKNKLTHLIDKNSSIPLYRQIELVIKDLLNKEPYSSGAFLPGENILIERFDVGRQTVRQALQNLVNQGIITREQGKGSRKVLFDNKIYTHIEAANSFSTEMQEQGKVAKNYAIKTQIITPPEEVALAFKTNTTGKLAYLLRRYGYTNSHQADVYFESYFSPNLALENDDDFKYNRIDKLYKFLKQTRGIEVASSDEKLEVIINGSSLNIKDLQDCNIPIIKRTRLVIDKFGELFEYSIVYYRSDVFIFKFQNHLIQEYKI